VQRRGQRGRPARAPAQRRCGVRGKGPRLRHEHLRRCPRDRRWQGQARCRSGPGPGAWRRGPQGGGPAARRDVGGAEQRSRGVGARSALRTSDLRRPVRAELAERAQRVAPHDPAV